MATSEEFSSKSTPTLKVRVESNERIAADVYLLRFTRSFDFVPGQVVALTVDPLLPARYYSIASGADEPEVGILYDLVPEGVQTPRMCRLEPGQEVLVSKPFGSFIDPNEGSWWIATGTGIAPFISMARSGLARGKQLVHGGRSLSRFYFHDELESTRDLGYVCCCSGERADWAYPGRLTGWLTERIDLPTNARYLLCGGAGMVVEVRDILIARGVPFEKVSAEIYF